MIPSMSRPANPYDNASCESFMKTLKREEIYANTYRDLDHLRVNHGSVHRAVLQSRPVAFGAGLPLTGRVRARGQFGDHGDWSHHAVFQASRARSTDVISQGSV